MITRYILCKLVLFSFSIGCIEGCLFRFTANLVIGEQEPEMTMTPTEFVQFHGYPAETHYVTTKDDYILTIHRIPHGKNGSSSNGPPVFIQHGFISSSAVWLMNPPEKNLPYLLADQGYDVWIGNFRGSTFSVNHTSLSPSSSEFWDFSWEELALEDLPAVIDYALSINGAKKLTYIGHSMGTSSIFALLATKTEYNDKLNALIALAPVTIVQHMTSPLRYLGPGFSMTVMKLLQHGELPMVNFITDAIRSTLCVIPVVNNICAATLFIIFGPHWSQLDQSRIDVILKYMPSRTSVKLLEHYEQMIVSGKFCRFDYKDLNKNVYKQDTPPEFDLSKVTVPVALFWGENDIVTVPEDVATLPPKLPNLALNHQNAEYAHGDYLFAKNVVPMVYTPVIAFMKEYAPPN